MRRRLLICAALAACGKSDVTGPGSLPLKSVSVGSGQSCGVGPASDAYCWGDLLGNGAIGNSTLPVPIAGPTFAAVSAGTLHTCGLTVAGEAYCWGPNPDGRLGNGTTIDSWAPVPVSGGLTFKMLTAGGSHTCGLTPDGAAYCWGRNDSGELGDGILPGPEMCRFAACSTKPVPVSGGLTFIALSAGERHTCGVTRAHVAYCWGYNFDGELGNGTTVGPQSCAGIPCGLTPDTVIGGLRFSSMSAGFLGTCGVTTTGAAYCWGQSRPGPDSVHSAVPFAAVSAGPYHTCGVTVAWAAYCWGDNSHGELGTGDSTFASDPVPVAGGLTFAAVSVGGFHSCGVTPNNAAYCWGSNFYGELGNGTLKESPVPLPVGY